MRVSLILVAVVTVALTGMFAVGTWSGVPEVAADDCSLRVANTAAGDACADGIDAPTQSSDENNTDAVFPYPSAGSAVIGSVGFIDADEVGYFWSVARGDSVSDVFNTPGPVNRAILDVDVGQNALSSGAFVNWELVINGNIVGAFTINEGFLGPVNLDVVFAPIPGPVYSVVIQVTNEVAAGEGSHSLGYAGLFAHSIELLGDGTSPAKLDHFKCYRTNGERVDTFCRWSAKMSG